MKLLEKKLDKNKTKILCVVFNKFWKQHPTKQQFPSHNPSMTCCLRSKDKQVTFFNGLLYMDTPVLANQQNLHSSAVHTLDAIEKTYQEMTRDSQENPSCQHTMMMMINIRLDVSGHVENASSNITEVKQHSACSVLR